jgi:hypothetical protein
MLDERNIPMPAVGKRIKNPLSPLEASKTPFREINEKFDMGYLLKLLPLTETNFRLKTIRAYLYLYWGK